LARPLCSVGAELRGAIVMGATAELDRVSDLCARMHFSLRGADIATGLLEPVALVHANKAVSQQQKDILLSQLKQITPQYD
ncbi:hypothetical protein, partial [Klebsiella pneumoniae]|uniref:hypothetical protein n=1 Tax=Klebsiella pneumoniae TaxID=573 RepID=UPI00227083BF